MKIYAKSFYNQAVALRHFVEASRNDCVGAHSLVDDPQDADCVVFVENAEDDDYFYHRLLTDPLLDDFGPKCFMYNEVDQPWNVLPGLYCSMPASAFDASSQRAFPYLFNANPYIGESEVERQWLYSFQGAPNHRVRRKLYGIEDDRSLIEDTSSFSIWTSEAEALDAGQRKYADTLAASAFVLCPRGSGTSSYRLFETMQARRVPVIISDEWVAPSPMDWSFAIRVPERDIPDIPEILRSHEDEWDDRSAAARRCWETHFSPEVIFNYAGDQLGELSDCPRTLTQARRDPHYLKISARYRVRQANHVVRAALGSLR